MSGLTDKQALDLAAKHGMKVAENPESARNIAGFVRAIYKEGRDAHVMKISAGGKRKPDVKQDIE